MAQKNTFSVRIDPERQKELDSLADSMDRPRSYLVAQAIEQFLDYHRWKAERVAEGLADLDRGDVVPHEEVFSKLRRRSRPKSR